MVTITPPPTITPTVAPSHAGPVVLHFEDFQILLSEQQAADLIDNVTAHLHERAERSEPSTESTTVPL